MNSKNAVNFTRRARFVGVDASLTWNIIKPVTPQHRVNMLVPFVCALLQTVDALHELVALVIIELQARRRLQVNTLVLWQIWNKESS